MCSCGQQKQQRGTANEDKMLTGVTSDACSAQQLQCPKSYLVCRAFDAGCPGASACGGEHWQETLAVVDAVVVL
jgi:hypothetical protein